MSEGQTETGKTRAAAFEKEAARVAGVSEGPLRAFWYFLRRTRSWWMAPIIFVLLAVGVLLVLSSSTIAPLIYTIF